MKVNILVTICARGGSKGVRDKNVRLLAGKPLIAYTIRQAIQWGKADHAVVSTDSQKIANVAKEYGVEVPFRRPKALATDRAAKLPVLRHALVACERLYKQKFQFIVDLDPTSPVRTSKDIENAVTLCIQRGADSVVSVTPARRNPYFNMVEQTASGKIVMCKTLPHPVVRRQDAPRVFDMNASIYVYRRDYLANPAVVSPVSPHSEIYIMGKWAIDIDTEMDFQFIEYLMNHKKIVL